MRVFSKFTLTALLMAALIIVSCNDEGRPRNDTAKDEQALTEQNQQGLLSVQPPPRINWSLERDNLIKRFKLQNDRAVQFYMYVFIEGVSQPVGYYLVNKVSSVNSQLTNPQQIIRGLSGSGYYNEHVVESPAEDGSYGTNGDAVFGFTPESIYIEHNMRYVVSTVPLSFAQPVNRLAVVNAQTQEQINEMMKRIGADK